MLSLSLTTCSFSSGTGSTPDSEAHALTVLTAGTYYIVRLLKLGPASLGALARPAVTLARAEGLEAHARSVTVRLDRQG